MIDYQTFDETYSDFGSEMIHEIVDIYISEYKDRFVEMRKNIDLCDMDSLGKNAHSLKGATAVLYDDVVTDLARQLEFKGKNNDFDGVEELFSHLKQEVDRLVIDLEKLKIKYS